MYFYMATCCCMHNIHTALCLSVMFSLFFYFLRFFFFFFLQSFLGLKLQAVENPWSNWLLPLACSSLFLCSALTNPLQILAAQASTSPPVLVNRPSSVEMEDAGSLEPEAKRPKMEDEGVASVPQPVIVAMTPESSDWASERERPSEWVEKMVKASPQQ